jgi:hypothetical protein
MNADRSSNSRHHSGYPPFACPHFGAGMHILAVITDAAPQQRMLSRIDKLVM